MAHFVATLKKKFNTSNTVISALPVPEKILKKLPGGGALTTIFGAHGAGGNICLTPLKK